MKTQNQGIKKEFGKLTVDSVKADRYKDNLGSAQLRQEVRKIYPAASVSNNMQDGIFGADELGVGEGKVFTETRITWLPVPKDSTVEQVAAQLANFPDARIYKVLSMEPILTDGQEYAIENGITDLETIAEAQIVRDGEGNPALYNGEVQYSAKFFSKDGKADIDHRPALIEDAAPAATVAQDDLATS